MYAYKRDHFFKIYKLENNWNDEIIIKYNKVRCMNIYLKLYNDSYLTLI